MAASAAAAAAPPHAAAINVPDPLPCFSPPLCGSAARKAAGKTCMRAGTRAGRRLGRRWRRCVAVEALSGKARGGGLGEQACSGVGRLLRVGDETGEGETRVVVATAAARSQSQPHRRRAQERCDVLGHE